MEQFSFLFFYRAAGRVDGHALTRRQGANALSSANELATRSR